MEECTYGNLEEVDMAIHALEQERSVITELEKIKEEIHEKSFNYPLTDNFENDIVICVINVSDMYKIIDKRIFELKGDK